MLTQEQKKQFIEIMEELGENLDISESQFDAAVKSYNAVGGWLSSEDSLLKPYNPYVQPQGSIIIGTTIKPIHKEDDVDIDLVCELSGKDPKWTQKDLKRIVGDQLESHKTYESLLDKEGRRCWTLKYREDSEKKDKYHMDILPAVIANGYKEIVTRAFSDMQGSTVERLSIRITDNQLNNYSIETNPDFWLKSNPFGYAIWFVNRATINTTRFFSLTEAVKEVPKFQKNKFPLQRVVQLLKRHRDIMFAGDNERPISIIITTLAAYAYNKQDNVYDSLIWVIENMHSFIQVKVDNVTGKSYKFIGNPVNMDENFADKWRENPAKEEKFYKWLDKIKKDMNEISQQRGSHLMEHLSKSFGENEVRNAFTNIGNKAKLLTEQGNNRFDTKIGIVSGGANVIKPHNFYGTED